MMAVSSEAKTVSAVLNFRDYLSACRVRLGINRYGYRVEPGLYRLNNPSADSLVCVSANYKLSFDILRSNLGQVDAWILVLDTKGINVWCAAGKGTFGTDELVSRIAAAGLSEVVSGRRLIVPQLGAVGIAAHEVARRSGFSVIYGPVRASDIKEFVDAGLKATPEMRMVRFNLLDRLVLTPVEFIGNFKYVFVMLVVFGVLLALAGRDAFFQKYLHCGAVIFTAYLAGIFAGPALLPWIPARSFALKGAILGLALFAAMLSLRSFENSIDATAWFFIVTPIVSFFLMNFTGSSTYTSLSGVKKEMHIAVPLQIISVIIGLCLWLVSRFLG
jgi:hypothetical protein